MSQRVLEDDVIALGDDGGDSGAGVDHTEISGAADENEDDICTAGDDQGNKATGRDSNETISGSVSDARPLFPLKTTVSILFNTDRISSK